MAQRVRIQLFFNGPISAEAIAGLAVNLMLDGLKDVEAE